jgi:hypothetical protein
MARHQRFAGMVAMAEIADRLSPEDLAVLRHDIKRKREDAVPALAAEPQVQFIEGLHRTAAYFKEALA